MNDEKRILGLKTQLRKARKTIYRLRNEITHLKEELDTSYDIIDFLQEEYQHSQSALDRERSLTEDIQMLCENPDDYVIIRNTHDLSE